MKKRENDTHISTTVEIKQMLQEMADKEERAMRTVLARLVRKEYEKVFKNGRKTGDETTK
jgi:predicted transcriptional regulator